MRRTAPVVAVTLSVILSSITYAPLAAQQPVQLDTVRASAGSRLIAGSASVTRSVDVFERADIDALPVGSVSDVIARALGVDLRVRSPAQADLSIRGGSFEQVLVLVDGVPVNDRQTGHFHLDVAVPLDAVERIEVLRGPASAIYGSSAVGGVVNIVTRRSAVLGARVQGGSFGAFAAAADAGFAAGGIAARVDAELDMSDGHRPGTDHRTRQARVSFAAPLGSGTLRAAGGSAARDFGADAFYGPYDSYEETRTTTASISWRSRPSRFVIEPRVSLRRHDDDFILLRGDPAFYRNVHTTKHTSAELVARWQAAGAVALAAGADAGRSTIESNSLGNRSEDQIAGFAEAAIGDMATALLTVGVRLDHHSVFGSFVSTSAAAGYRLSSSVRLRASAASGFRAPSWTDRYYEDPANIGTPDLDVERFWTAEAGVELGAGPLRLDIAGFVRQADDLIDWGRAAAEPETSPWYTLNIAEASFRGVETAARLDIRRIAITARGALLSFDANPGAGFVSKYALQPLTRSASVELAVPVTPRGQLAIRGSSSRRADGEAWQVVDARASLTVRGARIFLDATNIFDDSWLDVSARPVAGRAFQVGARVRR